MTGKTCHICKVTKRLTEFDRNRREPDGFNVRCKECRKLDSRKYYEKHKEAIKQRMRTYYENGGKEVYRKRRLSPEGKAYSLAYKRSPKYKAYDTGYRQKNSDKKIAGWAVNRAVKKGRLPRISTLFCVLCGSPAEVYHHPRYEPEHRLDVVPLCAHCHSSGHNSVGTNDSKAPFGCLRSR